MASSSSGHASTAGSRTSGNASRLDPKHFRFQNSMAQCMLCRTEYLSLSEARDHEKTKFHQGRAHPAGVASVSPDFTTGSESTFASSEMLLEWQLDPFGYKATPGSAAPAPSEEEPDVFEQAFDDLDSKRRIALMARLQTLRDGGELNSFWDSLGQDSAMGGSESPDDADIELDDDDETDDTDFDTDLPSTSDWGPFSSKASCVLSSLFNSPALRFSELQQRAVLHACKAIDAPNVPSLYRLKKDMKVLQNACGLVPVRVESSLGNVFYINPITASICRDFGNPQKRPHMHFYPQATRTPTEVWQFEKWLLEVPDNLLTPMIVHEGRHFYVDELVWGPDLGYFIPQRWVEEEDGRMGALGICVRKNEDGSLEAYGNRVYRHVSHFSYNFPELEAVAPHAARFRTAPPSPMPHPLRAIAKGRRVVSVAIILQVDDASGAVTKQWNIHYNAYCSNACLPRTMLDRKSNIEFVSTSTHASPLEIIQGIDRDLRASFDEPLVTYDCETGEEVLVRVFNHTLAGDNPMQADAASSSGLGSNFFCRTCDVGGTDKHKESDEGYPTLFAPGKLRVPSETANIIHQQLELSTRLGTTTRITNVGRDHGVKDLIAQPTIQRLLALGKQLKKDGETVPTIEDTLRQELSRVTDGGEYMNPLLTSPGFNVHLDTPTEILHTVLLGVVKYFWGQTTTILDKSPGDMDTFRIRLRSVSIAGLNIDSLLADYICQFKGGLIGRHFKSLVQLMPSLIFDLVPDPVLMAWLLLGRLVVALWKTAYDQLATFLTDLESTINQLLNVAAICSPSIIISRPKFHFLTHLPLFIRRFGPPLLYATERYESQNHIFRNMSVHSNRQSPSHDVADQMARVAALKGTLIGFWWRASGQWVQASENVRRFGQEPWVVRHLGLDADSLGVQTTAEQGKVYQYVKDKTSRWKRLPSAKFSLPDLIPRWRSAEIRTAKWLQNSDVQFQYESGGRVVAANGDVVRLNDWACIELVAPRKELRIGRLVTLFTRGRSTRDEESFAYLQLGVVESLEDAIKWPRVRLTSEYWIVEPASLIACINVQHNCRSSRCSRFESRPIIQEREETARKYVTIQHSDDIHFLLNIQALHNHDLVLRLTPDPALHPTELYTVPDVQLHRRQAATRIRNDRAIRARAKAAAAQAHPRLAGTM